MDSQLINAFASHAGTVLHGVPLTPGYARVQVDSINPTFAGCPMPSAQEGHEMQTIGDAVGSFIQWPKKDIVLTPAPSSAPAFSPPAPTGQSQEMLQAVSLTTYHVRFLLIPLST